MEIEQITFDNYLLLRHEPLTFEEMGNIHKQIITHADITTEDFKEYWEETIKSAIHYSEIRGKWNFMSKAEKMDRDLSRTSAHNIVIDNFILLERIFKINNWDSRLWTEYLFLNENTENRTRKDLDEHRKRIGDFSNYLAFVYTLSGR